MKNSVLLVLLSLFMFGCAHHKDVRAGAEGVHRVVVQTDNTDEGARNAISQANHFCKERGNMIPAFVNEDKKYTGSMNEDTYNKSKTASKVASAVGGALWVFGGQNESTIGGITGLGGAVANQALGNGYTVEMRFKCI